MDATSLSSVNSTKILELEGELSTQLKDLVARREDVETMEDEVLALSAWCVRLSVLAGTRNMTAWIEKEGRKQSSAWDIVSALVERGRLGKRRYEILLYNSLIPTDLRHSWLNEHCRCLYLMYYGRRNASRQKTIRHRRKSDIRSNERAARISTRETQRLCCRNSVKHCGRRQAGGE